ncbi:unnamed protein product [Clonostachys rhizophaga]|uniref:Uncharacterized protein n=1 Tax=Clonostachys rhizophaga TaxID=160324 RepID=A0A9N9YMR0_9HYPO|nr:unnamed protein product [Clonostachys rhizophaga]
MTVLGKRKKPESAISQEEAEAIFRRHFEAQFQPIDEGESKKKSTKSQDTDGSDDQSADSGSDEDGESQEEEDVEGDEWGGLSGDSEDDDEIDDEDDDEPAIEVIDHSQPRVPNPEAMSKSELKAFMAKENNVILEHDTAKKRRKRDRGRDGEVNGPSVGRMRGAELRISDRDVRSIEGTRDVFGRKGGKGRRR